MLNNITNKLDLERKIDLSHTFMVILSFPELINSFLSHWGLVTHLSSPTNNNLLNKLR